MIKTGTYTFKGITFEVYAIDDPIKVSHIIEQSMTSEVKTFLQDIDNEEWFFENTAGSFPEHPLLRHMLIHVDKRPGQRDTVYQIVTHPKDLETAKELAQQFKAKIKESNDWGDTSQGFVIPNRNLGSKN